MKVIFLNTWNAKVPDAIKTFIADQSLNTEIFCFQEAYKAMQELTESVIPEYKKIEAYKYLDENDSFSQATYIKDIPILSSGAITDNNQATGLALYIQTRFGDKDVYICNAHGVSRPIDKLDNPGRIRQSEMIIDFFKNKSGIKIIGGDFNLLPEAESIRIFEENGYIDLIKKYDIKTTRNELAWAKYPNNKQYYADYAFISPDTDIKSFSVPNLKVSDHLPLILEI